MQNDPLLEAIAIHARALLTDLTPQELCNMSWALAKLYCEHKPLLKSLAAESIRKRTELKAQELSVTAWAFATMGITPVPLLDALSAEAIPKIQDFGMLELTNMAWAFAQLDVHDAHLPGEVYGFILVKIGLPVSSSTATPNGCFGLCWSAWRQLLPELMNTMFDEEVLPLRASPEMQSYSLFLMASHWAKDAWQEELVRGVMTEKQMFVYPPQYY